MYVIGLNHKTAPIQIREKFFLNPSQQDVLLSELKSNPSVAEAFVLSTCNRIEIYLKRVDEDFDGRFIIPLIVKIKRISLDFDPQPFLYAYSGHVAVEHFLKVVTGLDSLVLGEKQILGQVKTSVDRARDMGILSKYFNILTNLAIRAGKKAQNETGISSGGSSVSWAAVSMAEQQLGTLQDKSVLVIGAGKMGEMALNHLVNRGASKIYLMNRTGEKADLLAMKFKGIPASFMDIKEILREVDLCLCSVGAPHYIINPDLVSKVMGARHGQELLLIDISMPRNIDPQVQHIDGVSLFSIDDLDKVVYANMQKRQGSIDDVEAIITQKIVEFNEKIAKLQSHAGSDFLKAV